MQGVVETVNKCAPRVLVLKDDRGNSYPQSSLGSCRPIARVALTVKGKEEGNLFSEAEASIWGMCVLTGNPLIYGRYKRKSQARTTLALP